jgi:hypothetical protein
MRTTMRDICIAFEQRRSLKLKNTKTNGLAIYLFDKLIVYRQDNDVYFTLAGWNTVTTRSRLNDFFRYFDINLSLSTCKEQAYLNTWVTIVLEHEQGTTPTLETRHTSQEISEHKVYKISDFTSRGNL